jgi:hypothetical protein
MNESGNRSPAVAVQAKRAFALGSDIGNNIPPRQNQSNTAGSQAGLPKSSNDPYGATEKAIGIVISGAYSGRGRALDLLHRDEEADHAWDEAFLVCPADIKLPADIQSERLSSPLKAGNLAKAVVMAGRVDGKS